MRSLDRSAGGAPVTSVAGAPWRPLLSGALRDRSLETAHRLTGALDRWDLTAGRDASLSGGSAGVAVCLATLARAAGDDRAAGSACARLDQAVDLLTAEPMPASLFAGFTGIAWAAEVVDHLLGEEGEDRNEGIDDALAGWLTRSTSTDAPYDLVHGLTGLGVYALARWPRPGAVRCLTRVLDQLTRRARHDDSGTYWWTSPTLLFGANRTQHPEGGVDLGVAHGLAGVLPLLARMRALGLAEAVVEPMLDGAVRWLSAHLLETGSGPALPAFVAPGSTTDPARSAWCYGSPGVAAALALAAIDTERPDWWHLAVRLGLEAADRPLDRSGVTDAGLCHGAAGLAHMFNRLHQLTGIPAFAGAARTWIERTLDAVTAALSSEDPAPTTTRVPWNGSGVLEGASGIALALLAASTGDEPLWDPMFLVATPAASVRERP
jgi:lantibiotic modifying enzyme